MPGVTSRKRILLTGAAGRVGRLVRPWLGEIYALRVCDIVPLSPASADDEVVSGDLADAAVARRAVAGVDAVVHLAGRVAPAVSFEDTLAPNYRAVLNLLEECREARVPRFVFASSHHVVGLHAPGALDVATPPAPDGFYALSKTFGEAACAMYAGRFGLRTLIVRIGNADPEVVDGRRERLWVSARDLTQLFAIGIDHEAVRCETVYGVSKGPDSFFPQHGAERFGYRPQDDARDHRSPNFRPLAAMSAAEGAGHVGGHFATSELPYPFTKT